MKMSELKKELQNSDAGNVLVRLEKERRDLFQFRINAAASHVKDFSQYKKKRKTIARLLTYLRGMGIKRDGRL